MKLINTIEPFWFFVQYIGTMAGHDINMDEFDRTTDDRDDNLDDDNIADDDETPFIEAPGTSAVGGEEIGGATNTFL